MFSTAFTSTRRAAGIARQQVRNFSRSTVARKEDVVILSASRTPIGAFQGALKSLTGPQLGAVAIKDAIKKAGVNAEDFDEAILGNVCSANVGQAPARQAARLGGLPWSTNCTTINKVCSSGLKTVALAAQSIALGQSNLVLAGGFESMSNIPYYVPKARTGYGYGHGELVDGVIKDGLWDAFDDRHMGLCAEHCAEEHNFSREEQDEFALNSYAKAAAAIADGRFKEEIAPVEIPSRKGPAKVISEDEEVGKLMADNAPKLRPAFKKDGTVTAANASALNDGAAAIILASASWAAERGLKPIARIEGYADAEHEPVNFTTAPSLAVPKAVERAGLKISDIDYFELNEAFSVVGLVNNKLLDLDASKVDVNGGAVALGHPIGASGARILVTLLHVLKQNGGKYGAAGICNGGGGASSVVVSTV